ncbi:glycosyltransferase family 2 protein [Desulfatibacillum aliphaticivorans]|uniref:glycosyltransferase family 2 protein n=1 Tax=Desulfatibacillum aliphaticivorans TaxID=218208 RepID=UPI0004082A85|nr:glycosyltransferase family 2 protein [Desulfatibacillum aliphaticivorans]
MVSIIVRTKNEEKWIASCLKAVFAQTYQDFEVIVVDNKSDDKTVEKAKAFAIKLVEIDRYLPGKAINRGVEASKGDIIVCLSGHCIPTNTSWLENLIKPFEEENVAGVYGRQEPMTFTTDWDKRDLLTVFGLDRKVQKKDSFFHNANSAVRRDLWEKYPFDEDATNIEDRIWAKQIISLGYFLVYEPAASVFHWHGIHQNRNPERCQNVVQILTSLENGEEQNQKSAPLDLHNLNIVALIPVKDDVPDCGGKSLLEYTVQRALQSQYINRVVVSADSEELAAKAREAGAQTPFIRPADLSLDHVDLSMVLQYSLQQLEDAGEIPDILVILEITYPFRRKDFIDKMIEKLVNEGLDSVIPVRAEYRTSWLKDNQDTRSIGEGFMPRVLKKSPLLINLMGLGCVTYPHFVRNGRKLGEKVGVVEVKNIYSPIEVRDEQSVEFASKLIGDWWEQNQ